MSQRTPSPAGANQSTARWGFRVGGGVLLVLGAVLLVVGFREFSDPNVPFGEVGAGFGQLVLGGLAVVIGLALLNAGFVGVATRYAAGETAPVVKDTAHYLSDGEGVLGVGRTRSDAVPGADPGADPGAGPFCRACGVRNDGSASFCDSCGQTLA